MTKELTKNQLKKAKHKLSRADAQNKFAQDYRAIIAAQDLRMNETHGPEKCPWENKEILDRVCNELENQ